MYSGFLTRSNTNRAVQPQKMARGLKFRILEVVGSYYLSIEKKALISCAITVQPICAFFFAYAKSGSHYCQQQDLYDIASIMTIKTQL